MVLSVTLENRKTIKILFLLSLAFGKLDEFRLNLTSCQAGKLTTDKLGKKQSRLLADKRKLE